MTEWLDHARRVYIDCILDGMGVFAIAELLAPNEEGRKQWTEPELIQAIARQLQDEAGNDQKQRSQKVQHPANQSRKGPANKPLGSPDSIGSHMRLHRRAGTNIRQPGQACVRSRHLQTSSTTTDKEAV